MTQGSRTTSISNDHASESAATEKGPRDESDDLPSTAADRRRSARDHWAAGRLDAASDAMWAAYALDPRERATKKLLANFLRYCPTQFGPSRRAAYLSLLRDQDVEPDEISSAGWHIALSDSLDVDPADDSEYEALSTTLNANELALALLQEAPVASDRAERALSRQRRWLLLSGQWTRFPGLINALAAQARLNGGAWPFDQNERERLVHASGRPMLAAYLPAAMVGPVADPADTMDPVTRAVAAQYEGWPYPAWRRITRDDAMSLRDAINKIDPDAGPELPVKAQILIAGCGTGREAAITASRYPDAAITAIDLSEASLRYARRRCDMLGIGNDTFHRRDLHRVDDLGKRFDVITAAGVLHHLPDPEKGWEALAAVLEQGGVMRVMVYSRASRLWIAVVRGLIRDLMGRPVDDDLLREVRRRIFERADHPMARMVMRSPDFYTLAGTYDLLLHRHEDAFDIPRIARALDRLGLRLLNFDLRSPERERRYAAIFPHDPLHRDVKCWERFESENPQVFLGMYSFWCRRDLVAS